MLVRAPAASRVLLRPLHQAPRAALARPSFTTRTQTPITRFCTGSSQSVRPTLRSTTLGLRSDVLRQQRRGEAKVSKEEQKNLDQKLPTTPQTVSASSTTQAAASTAGAGPHEEDVDMMAGIRQDMSTIKDTFDLSSVPRDAYVLGLAGVLPYFATSAGTVYCAWEINHAVTTGGGFLMSGGMAEALLHVLEPLQIGYGAVIISFLGAIHWGLEWANYGGRIGYRRYAIGVVAPAVAWPTLLLPPNYALISQFLAFVFLYYADNTACRRGWAPPWYGMYRFVLTFVVGASIVASLIGRGEIAHMVGDAPTATQRIKALQDTAQLEFEQAERAKAQERQAQIAEGKIVA